MFKNYLKIFIKVSKQNKLFTFLSIFGISLTIMFIMIIAMTFENIINGSGPEENSNHILHAWRLKTESTVEGERGYSTGGLSQKLYTDYLQDLKIPEYISLHRSSQWEFIYNGNRFQKSCIHTDGNFWKIFSFNFSEGRPFSQEEVKDGNNYAVITESLKELFFGNKESACGKTIEYNNMQLIIVGVVEDVPPAALNTQASIYIPYNLIIGLHTSSFHGGYHVVFKARSKKDKAAIISEVQEVIRRIDLADDKLRYFMPGPNSEFEKLLIGYGDPEDYSGRAKPLLLFFGQILGFILLPAINLMALNFSRIRERSEEIGVRKTFGASASVIRKQFVFENIMLTMLGGVVGIVLSYLVVALFGSEIEIPLDFFRSVEITYSFNILVFLSAFASCLLFAILSGVLPAVRMSKMKPVKVLRGGEL